MFFKLSKQIMERGWGRTQSCWEAKTVELGVWLRVGQEEEGRG